MKALPILIMAAALCTYTLPAQEAGEFNPDLDFAQVEYVSAEKSSNGSWTFSVTIRHNDEAWNHYAELWEVADTESDAVFAERALERPHEDEQPFTRSKSRIVFPKGQRFIEVRARCTLHGFEGRRILIDLEKAEGEGYRIR